MSAFFALAMAMPGLRRLVLGPVQAPPQPQGTAHHCFVKTGPGGALMVLVLDADEHRAVETITKDGITEETTTPIGPEGLAVWYAQRCVKLLADGWHPSTVIPPLQVPSAP